MAAKLKDGFFLGDFEAAQDLEFIVANKITRIINCAGREVANAWERSGIRYLTYYWPESGNCIIFDESNSVLDEIYSFVEEAVEAGESVLVHCTDGVSRACFCCAVYFMLKYRWTLNKALTFLQSKRPDLSPRAGFLRQLQALDQSLQRVTRAAAKGQGEAVIRRYTEWEPALIDDNQNADDELLLCNTFLNSQPAPEEVVIAAQSGAPLPRAPAGGNLHLSQNGVHFAAQPTLIDGRAARATSASGKRQGVSWIDDPKRIGTTHGDVPVSPITRRPIPERPPTASYSSLALGHGWVDHSGTAIPVPLQTGVALVAPAASGTVSAAAAHVPAPYPPSPSKLKSVLRGSQRWVEQYSAQSQQPTNDSMRSSEDQRPPLQRAASAAPKLSTSSSLPSSASSSASTSAVTTPTAQSAATLVTSESKRADDRAEPVRAAPSREAPSAPGGAASNATAFTRLYAEAQSMGRGAPNSAGNITGMNLGSSSTFVQHSSIMGSKAGASRGDGDGAEAQPARPRSGQQSQQQQAAAMSSRAGMPLNSSMAMGASVAPAASMAVTMRPGSSGGPVGGASLSATANAPGNSAASSMMRAASAGGPVRAVAASLQPAATLRPGTQTVMSGVAESVAALSRANLAKSLGPQTVEPTVTGGSQVRLASSLGSSAGSQGALSIAVNVPTRGASSRVRGYSPGPNKSRLRAGAPGTPTGGAGAMPNALNGAESRVRAPSPSTVVPGAVQVRSSGLVQYVSASGNWPVQLSSQASAVSAYGVSPRPSSGSQRDAYAGSGAPVSLSASSAGLGSSAGLTRSYSGGDAFGGSFGSTMGGGGPSGSFQTSTMRGRPASADVRNDAAAQQAWGRSTGPPGSSSGGNSMLSGTGGSTGGGMMRSTSSSRPASAGAQPHSAIAQTSGGGSGRGGGSGVSLPSLAPGNSFLARTAGGPGAASAGATQGRAVGGGYGYRV